MPFNKYKKHLNGKVKNQQELLSGKIQFTIQQHLKKQTLRIKCI
jgi:hypothetical protein